MITTIHNSIVHVLKLQDQILLHLLAVTTIVSLVILEHMVVNLPNFTTATHYGMEKVAYPKTVAAMTLDCHGSSVNSL